MPLSHPVSPALVGVCVWLPGMAYLGRRLAEAATPEIRIARAVAPALALASWLVPMLLAGRLTGSFAASLWLSTSLCGALGSALWWRQRRSPAATPEASREPWWVALVAALVIAPAAFGWALHDEVLYVGHMSIPAQLLNGTMPPVHGSFPEFALRYHYGFDLVVAALAAMTRLSVDLCIDVVTVVGFAYAATLAWHLGEVTIGRGAGRATAALMLLAGGVPTFVSEVPVSLHPFWHGIRAAIPVGGVWLSPPLPSYFLQHPWGLGIPLALALLLLLDQARIRRGAGGAFVLLTVALAASQLVLAVTLAPALALRALLRAPRERRLREVALWTLLLTGAGIGAWLSGGFFAKGPEGPSTLEWALGVTESFESDLWWLGMSSGLVIPLGLIGLRRLDAPNRWLAASMIVGALTLVILLRVRGSWDIVKFLTVAMLMAGWAASAELDHLARRGTAQRYLAGVLGAGCIAWGSTFLLMLAVRPSGLDETFSASLELPSDDDLAAIDWLRRRLPARELVYRRRPFARSYAVWGGLSVAWIETETPAFAFGDERIRRREALLATLPLATGPWLEEGIRWIVLDAEAEDLWLAASCERWIRAGLARERTRFGGLRVVEIVRAGDVGGPGPAVRRARD